MQVNQLTKLGVKAVRVGKASQLSDITSGRYRFGVWSLVISFVFYPGIFTKYSIYVTRSSNGSKAMRAV